LRRETIQWVGCPWGGRVFRVGVDGWRGPRRGSRLLYWWKCSAPSGSWERRWAAVLRRGCSGGNSLTSLRRGSRAGRHSRRARVEMSVVVGGAWPLVEGRGGDRMLGETVSRHTVIERCLSLVRC